MDTTTHDIKSNSMLKPDVIVCWPRNNDYPLWRQFIRDNRYRFEKVIIVFTETNQGYDYREFVKNAMANDDVTFLQSPDVNYGTEDWRNIAVNFALESTDSNFFWFTEEDFFPESSMWDVLNEKAPFFEVMAAYDNERMHPCCIFIDYFTLKNKTTKNFGIQKDKLDHFGYIQKQLEYNNVSIYKIPEGLWTHMAGLSQNFKLITDGEEPNHKVYEFKEYLKKCLDADVPKHEYWTQIVTEYLNRSHEKSV